MKRCLLIVMVVLLLAGTGVLFGQAQRERVLQMYTALDNEEAQYYIEAFEEETGINVNWVRLSAGEVAARVESEASNPQASVWFGGPNSAHIAAAQKDLLTPYQPNIDYELPEEFRADDWLWTGFYAGAIGFVSNKNFLEEHGIDPPSSWDDLLIPEFSKNVSLAYPYTSGTAYTTFAGLVQAWGETAALDWWEEFDQHSIHQYTSSGTGCIPMAGLGEIAVGIAFSHDIVAKGIEQGYPLVMSFPEEGTPYEVGAMSIIKGGPSEELAKQFIDWAMGVEAQNLFQRYSRLPVNPKADVAPSAVPLEEVTLFDFDAIRAGTEKDALIEKWRDRIGK